MKFKVGDKVNVKVDGRYYHQSKYNPFVITSVYESGYPFDIGLPYQLVSVNTPDYQNTYGEEDLEFVSKGRIHSTGGNI